MAGKSVAFADLFPGQALKPTKSHFAGQPVACAHNFVEEESDFGPQKIAMRILAFGLRVERFFQTGILALRFADEPDISAE